MPDKQKRTTHFGYQEVDPDDKAGKVADVFHSVAAKYDVMNDVMSFGIHRIWKRFTIEMGAVRNGQHVLDIAGGTGDLAAKFARQVGSKGRVVLSDINQSMLSTGRSRLIDKGMVGNIDYVQANAECLPFADNYFDCITIAFGLRNVTYIDKALQSMQRILKPGGKLLILEFSKPVVPGLGTLYDHYSFKVLPLLGKFIANDENSYRYLAESIRMHPNQKQLLQMMETAGLECCQYYNLTGGVVALHKGYKI
ncbi:MAG: bifunctional demethylmenaquinone methyltransferase/2-methoxy-6-polyprenyl-1,4-benzoquinol methylase UbiE [Gammaproteobacteria bacterium]|nr:bifunctional demethylmenaquinone methyltransferase/2-methoxy-6-polyprenyl-1,4-benzoquinol methylase UbiE [Gammaproteobacteria bacterium]